MKFLGFRLRYLLSSYKNRCIRLLSHLRFSKSIWRHNSDRWLFWPIDLFFYVIDLFLLSDLIDIVWNGFKDKRQLSTDEKLIIQKLFGSSVDIDQIFIVENCRPIKPNLFFAFVSFNTIHCVKEIPVHVLVHELVHIWQYQRFGSVYIFRALFAQNSINGYDYCGIQGLMDNLKTQSGLLWFNFEQQAEIVEDYYKLRHKKYEAISTHKIYEYYVNQLHYI